MTLTFPLTLTFELDLDTVKVNQRVKYLGQRLFIVQKLLSGHADAHTHTHTHTHTHQTDCFTWTTKVVGKDFWRHVVPFRASCVAP